MIHHQYNPNYNFVKAPIDFNKYTDRELLQYCLGATMYMPGTKDFAQAIIDKKYPGLTSMVMCFEDACKKEDVPAAELNCINVLETLANAVDEGILKYEDIPLIFFLIVYDIQWLLISAEDIDEQMISDHLYTKNQPDPDFILRPSGEKRISNFLLWQIAYSEFVYMDVLWPDFTRKDLDDAIIEFNRRNRRFGGV